ncbi:MAG: site-specific integrase [Betaproteobacteria bacterium]|nr:site-specific integrase [Betaproteobacteria bacterium]
MSELIHLMEGAVVLYKRDRSGRWQARLKMADKSWKRVSTGEADAKQAAKVALKLHYEAEFKREHKLPESTRRFGLIADAVVADLKAKLDAGEGKAVYTDYISCIENYLKPYFRKYNVDSVDGKLLKQFEKWRVEKMGKEPVHSTITTHNSALNRIFDYAADHGWVARTALPVPNNKGKKSEPRPAFTMAEYKTLTAKLPAWVNEARTEKSKYMRELLRDYVLVLANTGMRHGTESMNLKWRNIDWHIKNKEKHLRMFVNGKTGPRHLIARHNTADYLKRIQQRFSDLAKLDFDKLLKEKVDQYVFRLRDGTQSGNLHQTFEQLLRDTDLLVGAGDQKRTLYSLRHSYATFQLQAGIGIHDLAKQMGTSVQMIEQHYSKLVPELIADKLAGPKYEKKKKKKD